MGQISTAEQERYTMGLPGSGRPGTLSKTLGALLPALALLAVIPYALQQSNIWRVVFAVLIFMLLWIGRRSSLIMVAALVYLTFLGEFRRQLGVYLVYSHNDPLILAVPAAAFLIACEAVLGKALKTDTWITKLWLAMVPFFILGLFTGGLTEGLAGSIFWVPCFLWLFVGQQVGTDKAVRTVLWTLVVLGVLSAVFGIYQTLYGLSPVDKAWLASGGLGADVLGKNEVREFAFFSSMSEYAFFLLMALLAGWTLFQKGAIWAVTALPLLALALFYTSSRGSLVEMLLGMVVIWAVKGKTIRSWTPRIALAIALGILGMGYTLSHSQSLAANKAQADLVNHDAEGLQNINNPNKSTVGIHEQAVLQGFTRSFSRPFGYGLGSTNLAAVHYHSVFVGTEVDITDAFGAMGPVAGFIYVALVITVLVTAARVWHRTRNVSSLAALGILVALNGQWLHGGNYTAAFMAWFLIGSIDRQNREIRRLDAAQARPALSLPAAEAAAR